MTKESQNPQKSSKEVSKSKSTNSNLKSTNIEKDKVSYSVDELIQIAKERHELSVKEEAGMLDRVGSSSLEKKAANFSDATSFSDTASFSDNETHRLQDTFSNDDNAFQEAFFGEDSHDHLGSVDNFNTPNVKTATQDNTSVTDDTHELVPVSDKNPKNKKRKSAKKTDSFDSLFTKEFLWDCIYARDKGNGILYSHIYHEKYSCLHKEYWLEYNGNHWQMCDISKVQNSVEGVVQEYEKLLKEVLISLKESKLRLEEGDEHAKFEVKSLESKKKMIQLVVNSLHTVNGVNNCLTFSRANDKTTLINSDMLDADPFALCCSNGVVDIRTGDLRAGSPSDYITRCCQTSWKGLEHPSPKWEKMVFEVLGEDKDVAHYFNKLVGMAMCGQITEKIFIILLGEDGDSGKTTIFETLFDILTGYVAPMPVEMLLDRKNPKDPDSPTPSIMSLKGRRLTWASEPGENRRFSVENIKLMSGNDSLTGRNPWDKDISSFSPTHTLFLLTNHKMRASAHDQAFWSRLRLIDCPYNFVPNPDPTNPRHRKRVDGLREQIIKEESSGVLAWVVRGYMAYLMEGIDPPEAIKKATSKYRREEDVIAEFIDNCLEPVEFKRGETDDRISGSDLYDLFKKWYVVNISKNVLSNTIFGRMATKHMEKDKVGGKVYYFGYRITEDARKTYVE